MTMFIIKILTYWILASIAVLILLWIASELEQLFIRRHDRVIKERSAHNLERLTAVTPDDLLAEIETSEIDNHFSVGPDDLITLIEASERVHEEERKHNYNILANGDLRSL